MPLLLTYSKFIEFFEFQTEPHKTHISHMILWWSQKRQTLQIYCFMSTKNIMFPFTCLSRRLHCQMEQTILVPSGHVSEFPGGLPISIFLVGYTRPDVAGPLTSRVSSLTAHTDFSSLGHVGSGSGIQGVHPWCRLNLPFCSGVNNCHIPLIKPPRPDSLEGCPLGTVVFCWDSGLLTYNL